MRLPDHDLGTRRRLSASALSEPVEFRPPGQHGGRNSYLCLVYAGARVGTRNAPRAQATHVNFTVTAADGTDPSPTVANAAPEHLPDRGNRPTVPC